MNREKLWIDMSLRSSEGSRKSPIYFIKDGQVIIGTCTVDLSTNTVLLRLAISELERGKGYGSYLAKSTP